MSGDIFWLSRGQGGCYWNLKARDELNTPHCSGQPPTKRLQCPCATVRKLQEEAKAFGETQGNHNRRDNTTFTRPDSTPLPCARPLICYNLIPRIAKENSRLPRNPRSVSAGLTAQRRSGHFAVWSSSNFKAPDGGFLLLLSTEEFSSVTPVSLPTSKGECQAQRSRRLND